MLKRQLSVVLLVLSLCLGFSQAQSASSRGKDKSSSTPSGTKVDLNSASQSDLESLPGVGAATAKKIIAGRPYSSAADLSKAGVSQKTIDKISPMVTVSGSSASSASSSKKSARSKSSEPSSASSPMPSTVGKLDLNSASQSDLEALPGVGATTAKKIIAGRPYSSPSDLSKAGVSQKTIDKISPMVTASGSSASTSSSSPKPTKSPKSDSSSASSSSPKPSPGAKVDLNSASQADLEALPGVGAATAKKIIAGRPYSSVSDLSKAGVSQRTIDKISSMVTPSGSASSSASSPSMPADSGSSRRSKRSDTGSSPSMSAPASSTPAPAPASTGSNSNASSGSSAAPTRTSSSSTTPPSGSTRVWVNKDTKVYHLPGDRWYGKTKNGEYMTLSDAEQQGYRASKR